MTPVVTDKSLINAFYVILYAQYVASGSSCARLADKCQVRLRWWPASVVRLKNGVSYVGIKHASVLGSGNNEQNNGK